MMNEEARRPSYSSFITPHSSFLCVERAAGALGGEGEVGEDAEGRQADGDAVADVDRGGARLRFGARDEDGDAQAHLRRVDGDLVELRLARRGGAGGQIEAHRQALVGADEMV